MNSEHILLIPLYFSLATFFLGLIYVAPYPTLFILFIVSLVILFSFNEGMKWYQYFQNRALERHLATKQFKVAIIGSGFSGLNAGIECKKRGIPFVIYEKDTQLGGTWLNNQYPGCACDVPAHLYGYSFERYDWSTKFSAQSEILQYLEHCAMKYKVKEHIQFNTLVEALKWDEKNKFWVIKTSRGTESAHVVINGSGPLCIPSTPVFVGHEKFRGQAIHTFHIKKDFSFKDKKVAVIGTAASAIQLVPIVAEDAKKLYVFQRTPNWIIDKRDYKYSNFMRMLFKYVPFTCKIYRLWLYWTSEYKFLLIFRKNSNIANFLLKMHARVLVSIFGKKSLQWLPDYPMGCKRILLSNNFEYYHSITKDNVELITDEIVEMNENGIKTKHQQIDVDIILYATGFEPGKITFSIEGKQGMIPIQPSLFEAYWGITTASLPNYFTLLGPNTALGHNSIVWMAECQVNYIMKCLQLMIMTPIKELEVKKEKVDQWNSQLVLPGLKNMVWTGSCKSWYKDESGKVFTLWPGTTFNYWWGIKKAIWTITSDYHLS